MLEKVVQLLKNSTIQVPKLLLENYKDFKLTDQEFILIIYLLNTDYVLNPKKVSEDLKIELTTVFELISSLEEKDILKIETYQNKNVREEALNFDGLYQKLAFLVVNDNSKKGDANNLYDIFEKEFGRTLSPMEYEIISGWKDSKFLDELIIAALKEATYNGVSNLRYIDKILYEWRKKGISNKKDLEEKNKNIYQAPKTENEELYEYDWLNDNE